LIKDVSTPDSAEEGTAAVEDGEEAPASKAGTITYIAGRIFYDHRESGRWVYEALNHSLSSERFDKDGADLA